MALQGYTGPTNYVSRLDNRPNADGGLTADQLKAVFDQFGTEFVEWFNGTFVPDTEERLAAIEELPPTPLNKNLLHNWDFRNPVNQRGQSSYTDVHDGKYTIDRWCGLTPWGVVPANVTIQPGVGIEIESVPNPDFPNAYGALVQKIENAAAYSGLTLTFSVEVASVQATDGGIYPRMRLGENYVDITGPGIFRVTKTFGTITELLAEILVFTGATTSNSVVIKRCKLERGSVSTLAYDPPADYGEELRKCQRYLFNAIDTPASGVGAALGTGVAVSTTEIHILLPIPAHMRPIAATVILSSPSHFQCVSTSALNISALTYSATSTNTVMLIATVTGAIASVPYYLRRATGATAGYLLISKEL